MSPKPGSVGAWLLAARPRTLPVGATPVLVGIALAQRLGGLQIGPALAALVGALLLQIASNLANDVFDYEKGADTETRLGPTRAAQAGLLTPRALKLGLCAVLALALAVGIYLTQIAGWPVVAIGLASMAAAVAYTGGPYPLGYNGLGDVFVFVFFGLIAVAGTVLVAHGAWPASAWVAGAAVGLTSTCVLVVNNLRDYEQDRQVGKRTLVVRFGRRFGELEFLLCVLGAALIPALFVGFGWASWPVLLPLCTLPRGLKLYARVVAERGAALNEVLASTAKLVFLHGALFALGLIEWR